MRERERERERERSLIYWVRDAEKIKNHEKITIFFSVSYFILLSF